MASIKEAEVSDGAVPERQSLVAKAARPAGLVLGDACSFLLFAAVGRASHNEAAGLGAFLLVAETAAPFALGWFVVAPFFGVYRRATTSSVRSMLLRTALAWLCAWPVGLLLRGIFRSEVPPVSFAIVTLVANMLFLGLWRGAFAWIAHRR
jgi:FlaA1/EpsC-like NDP-sugar epimerase